MTGDRRRGALCVAFTAAWFLGVIARRSKAVETGFAHSIEIVEPQEGETVSATPFRVLIQTTGGFRVPEDGEIQLTMTYEGRGREVRVIQSLEFFCWNVLEAPLEISATLITTKNEPASAPAVVRVWQERGPHFVLNAPTTGQLLIAQTAVPFLFMFGGEVPEGAQVCAEVVCTSPGRSPEQLRRCMYDEGAAVSAQGANMRMDVALPAGNCSASVAVLGADGAPLSRAERRTFRVVEEQHECPAGSGVACLHGDCAGDGAAARCVCDSGFAGRQCAEAARPAGGAVGLEAAYLHLVKAALLDELYAKDRPGETAVVARSMVGRAGLDSLQRAVEELLDRGVPGDLMETGVWQGGSCMLMAAVLRARGATDRKVWVVDSFEGCPPPDAEAYPQDAADRHHTFTNLQVALNKVRTRPAARQLPHPAARADARALRTAGEQQLCGLWPA
jgi:hypothetical protein